MEEKNIFEGSKFGDKFNVGIPELNGKAVLIGHNKNGYICAVSFGEELKSECYVYNSNGNRLSGSDLRYDIVSKYRKPIDKEKLEELANESAEKTELPIDDEIEDFYYMQGFEAGFHKAMEE